MTENRQPLKKESNVTEDEGLQELMDAASREHPGVMEMLEVCGAYQKRLRMVALYERVLRAPRSATVADTSG